MERLTREISKKVYAVEDSKVIHGDSGYSGEAIERLAGFENICEALETKQIEITKELDQLKNEGKVKSAKFRQLMANKITNSNILSLFNVL